jgi:uncharacterized Zn finger protein
MFGNDLGEMLMKVKGTCPKCGAIMSFEEAANLAKKNGISDNVVMCEQCRSVYTIDLTPRALSFIADVTQRYTHLQKTAAKTQVSNTSSQQAKEKKWWQFWK